MATVEEGLPQESHILTPLNGGRRSVGMSASAAVVLAPLESEVPRMFLVPTLENQTAAYLMHLPSKGGGV